MHVQFLSGKIFNVFFQNRFQALLWCKVFWALPKKPGFTALQHAHLMTGLEREVLGPPVRPVKDHLSLSKQVQSGDPSTPPKSRSRWLNARAAAPPNGETDVEAPTVEWVPNDSAGGGCILVLRCEQLLDRGSTVMGHPPCPESDRQQSRR